MNTERQPNELTWQEQTDERLDGIAEQLRGINERLGLLLEILTPQRDDGPTLDDLLAKIVTLIGEQRPVIRRIDRTTGKALDILEGRKPRADAQDDGAHEE